MPGVRMLYGPFAVAPNSCKVSIRREVVYNAGRQPIGLNQVYNIQGKLLASNPSDIDAKLISLISAFSVNGYDFIVTREDGVTPSQHVLYNSDCVNGVQVTKLPSFPEGGAAQYVTQRDFEIELQGEIATPGGPPYLNYREKLTFTGGGSKWGYVETAVGPPQRQTFRQQTVQRITQEGSAEGYLDYPEAPAPIWPAYWLEDRSSAGGESPNRFGEGYKGYPISWRYEFESDVPLTGSPTLMW